MEAGIRTLIDVTGAQKIKRSAAWLAALPFVVLFLWKANEGFRAWPYHWGADDAYYYAYNSSILLDRDLDFDNQYRLSNLDQKMDPVFRNKRTATGKVPNIFPVGPALLWTPFFLAGHAIAWLIHVVGGSVSMDGYTRPYVQAVLTGNVLYAFAGLYLTCILLARFYPMKIAMVSTLGLWLSTWMFHYSRPFLNSEAPGLFAAAALLLLYFKHECCWRVPQDARRFGTLFLLGLAGGIAGLVRYETLAFSLIPAGFLLWSLRKPDISNVTALLSFAAGVAMGVLPQLIVWQILNGSWTGQLGGEFLPRWNDPYLLHTLFSARNGLFTCSPVVILSAAGLLFFAKQHPRWGSLILLLLGFQMYLNASMNDWWGAAAFGARRFANCFPLFAIGIAALIHALHARSSRLALITLPVILALAALNIHLESLYRNGKYEHEHAVPFSRILQPYPWRVYRPLLLGLELPVRWAYNVRFGIPILQPDLGLFIGEDVLFYQRSRGDLITGADDPLFGAGWDPQSSSWNGMSVRWMNGSSATLRLPLFFQRKKNLLVQMKMFPEHPAERLRAEFSMSGRIIASKKIEETTGDIWFRLIRRDYSQEVCLMQVRAYQPGGANGEPPRLALAAISFTEDN